MYFKHTSYHKTSRCMIPKTYTFGKLSRLHYTALITLYGRMVPFFPGYIKR